MSKSNIFTACIIGGVISLLFSIYYLIPGIDHVLVSVNSSDIHLKHFVAFFALSMVLFAVASINRKKA